MSPIPHGTSAGSDNLFHAIGTVSAQSPSGHYQFTDRNAPGMALQYRVRQVDLDGRYSYSAIRIIKDLNGSPSLLLRDNPVKTGMLTFDLTGYPNGNAIVTIFSINGKKIQSAEVRLHARNQTIHIPVHGAAAGIYLLTIQSGNLFSQKKFMVLQ